LEIVAYREEEQLQLWFEVDRQMKGFGGLLSSLLGTDELKSSLTLDASLSAEEVANQVLDYLTSLT
jgi:sporulation-control protein